MEGIAILVGCLICGILAACIARSKGRSATAWFIAGLFSGIIAVIIVALRKPIQASGSLTSKPQTIWEPRTALQDGIPIRKEEFLGDVIPPPRKELKRGSNIFPVYEVRLKVGSPTEKKRSSATYYGRYVEICRMPLADVSEVRIYEKPHKQGKLVFKGW